MSTNLQPLRPDIPFVDKDGKLSKEGYAFLYNLFNRVGGFANESTDDLITSIKINSIPTNAYYVQWQSPGPIGSFHPSTGKFTYLTVTQPITSTVATGTAPFVIASTTVVPNLYVDRAVLADTATILTVPTTFPANATDLPTVITLANALKAAGIAKGL